MTLHNATKKKETAKEVIVADTLFSRTKGLLGRKSLGEDTVMWIHRCNSIHTFFMKFPIDVVFLNRAMEVKAIYKNVTPWKVIWPVWSASSVLEFQSGALAEKQIELGDELYVGDSCTER